MALEEGAIMQHWKLLAPPGDGFFCNALAGSPSCNMGYFMPFSEIFIRNSQLETMQGAAGIGDKKRGDETKNLPEI